jgi:UV excision repair protein RAD23
LITQQQQQQKQQQPRSLDDSSSMPMRGMGGVGGGLGGLSGFGGMGGLGAPVGMAGSGGLGSIGGPDGDDGSAVEIEPAQVEEIRRLVAYNPTLIRPLVAQIKEQEPDLAADLTEDPETVLRFFSQGTDGDGSPDDRDAPIPAGSTAGPTALQPVSQGSRLTLADEASIDKVRFFLLSILTAVTSPNMSRHIQLQAVGYKRENVVQAFLSCGKNEQAAANLLADLSQDSD